MPHAARAWGAGERSIRTSTRTPATTSWSASTTSRRRKPRRRFPPEVHTDGEVRALLDACPDTHTGVRNRALLALLYRGGLRLGEALTLRPKDLDLEHGAVRVLHAKGDTPAPRGSTPGPRPRSPAGWPCGGLGASRPWRRCSAPPAAAA